MDDDKWFEDLKASVKAGTEPLRDEEIEFILGFLVEDCKRIVAERKTNICRKLTNLLRKVMNK